MSYFRLLIYALILFLASCNTEPDAKTYLARIDSLAYSLEESALAFESIDTSEIQQYFSHAKRQVDQLKQYDNIINTKPVISYNKLKNNFGSFLNAYPGLKTETSYTQSQLADLKYDIANEKLNFSRVHLYFDQEKQSVNVLKLKMDHYSELIEMSIKNYPSLNTEIEILIDSLYQLNEIQ